MKIIIFILLSIFFTANLYSQNAYFKISFMKNKDSVFYNAGDGYLKMVESKDSKEGIVFKEKMDSYEQNIKLEKPAFIELKFSGQFDRFINLYIRPGDSLIYEAYNSISQLRPVSEDKIYKYNEYLLDFGEIIMFYYKQQLFSCNTITVRETINSIEKSLNETLNIYITDYDFEDEFFIKTMREQIKFYVATLKLFPVDKYFSGDDYKKYAAELEFDNPEFLIFKSFRKFVEQYVTTHFSIEQEKLWEKYDNSFDDRYILIYFEVADKWIKNQSIKNHYYNFFLEKRIMDIAFSPNLDEILSFYESKCPDKEAVNEMKNKISDAQKMNDNVDAVLSEYDFITEKNESFSLSKFKGKYVFIDFWAPWCGPCVEEIPHIKQLVEKYKDIVFVSICVWDSESNWKNFLKENNMSWTQLYEGNNSDLTEKINVRAIPHFMILDKEGKVFKYKSNSPSDKELINVLDGLLAY